MRVAPDAPAEPVVSPEFREAACAAARNVIAAHEAATDSLFRAGIGDPHDAHLALVIDALAAYAAALERLRCEAAFAANEYDDEDGDIIRSSPNAPAMRSLLEELPEFAPVAKAIDDGGAHVWLCHDDAAYEGKPDKVACAEYILGATDEQWAAPRGWWFVESADVVKVANTLAGH